jgi:type II secretory pathway predicted ATPase ExeA
LFGAAPAPSDRRGARGDVLVLDNPIAPPVKDRGTDTAQPEKKAKATKNSGRIDRYVGQHEASSRDKGEGGADVHMSNSDSTFDIYTEHFGLHARPFSLVPDPDFIFWSPAHRRAYTMLEYGLLTRAPITLITGEVGSGKTTLLHHLLKSLDRFTKVGLVSNAHGTRGELLRWVLMSLDQPAGPNATYVDLFDAFQKYLISEYAQGNRVVVIFDEAQNLSRESLEELRMFTNINSNKDELLQLVLVGQPELRDIIRKPDLRQFAQRVASSFHLGPMDADTVQAYIGHRLIKAGARKNLFTRRACELVHEQTGGVPRLVNQLADLSMVYAFTNNQRTVTDRTVQQVLDDGTFFGAGAFEQTDDFD